MLVSQWEDPAAGRSKLKTPNRTEREQIEASKAVDFNLEVLLKFYGDKLDPYVEMDREIKQYLKDGLAWQHNSTKAYLSQLLFKRTSCSDCHLGFSSITGVTQHRNHHHKDGAVHSQLYPVP